MQEMSNQKCDEASRLSGPQLGAVHGRVAGWGSLALVLLFGAVAFGSLGCGPKYPKCKKDKDCHEGEFCVNGLCQMCRDDKDCPNGQQCMGGRCQMPAGFCQSDSNCPPGQECRNNRCVTKAQSAPQSKSTDTGNGGCQLQTVFFQFDSDTIDPSARAALDANAQCIKQRNLSKVHLTGHCDPRGTEEYNLALGDRRARSVLDYLSTLGVEKGKLSASSVGEEMASGSDESSWTQDRKVEVNER